MNNTAFIHLHFPTVMYSDVHVALSVLYWTLNVLHCLFFHHTHTHTQTCISRRGVSLRSELIRPKTGTALPNHIAASKSSVYISNYIVACGVLEHSGRSAFHLCAESRPLPHLPYFSSLLFPPALFIYFRQAYLCCCFSRLCAEHQRSFARRSSFFELSIAGQSWPLGAAGSSLMISLLSCSNLQGSTI